MNVALVVSDQDALALTLEEARFADNAFRTIHRDRFFPPKLKLRRDRGVVDQIRKTVAWLQVEYGDWADVPAVCASGTSREFDIHQDHSSLLGRRSIGAGYLGFGRNSSEFDAEIRSDFRV